MQAGPPRRFVGGADPLPSTAWDEGQQRRWDADPVWQATNIAPGAELAEAKAVSWSVSRLTSYPERQGGFRPCGT